MATQTTTTRPASDTHGDSSSAEQHRSGAKDKLHQAGDRVRDAAQQTRQKVRSAAHEAGDRAKHAASSAAQHARDRAEDMIDERRSSVSRHVYAVAHALHDASDRLYTDEEAMPAQYVELAAEQVERIASYIDERGLSEIRHDGEQFCRRHPEIVLGAAAIAGLAIGRFLRSSAQHGREQRGGNTNLPVRASDYQSGSEFGMSRSPMQAQPTHVHNAETAQAQTGSITGAGATDTTPIPATRPATTTPGAGPAPSQGSATSARTATMRSHENEE